MSADDLHDLPPGVASTPALPAGWSTGWSAEYGRAYYCNAQLGKTQWEPPTALPPPPPTASTAPSRCWPDVDTCVTNGDNRGGAWICLPWARGACALGPSCASLHRLPSQAEEDRLAHSADGLEHDVFGRKRGALPAALNARECRSALEEFEEWGKLVRTWTLAEPGAGYVKFRHRGNAQFCLEAMHGRPLRPDSDEVLELSWASADPALAVAQQGHALALRQMAEAKARRDEQHRMYDALEREGLEHAAKKLRTAGDGAVDHDVSRWLGADGGGDAPSADAAALAEWEARGSDAPAVAGSAVVAAYPGADPREAAAEEEEEPAATAAPVAPEAPLPDGWRSQLDPASGVDFYVHDESGATQWQRPVD